MAITEEGQDPALSVMAWPDRAIRTGTVPREMAWSAQAMTVIHPQRINA